MLILLGTLDTFYVLLRLDARNHDLAAAAETADAKIHTDAKHRKLEDQSIKKGKILSKNTDSLGSGYSIHFRCMHSDRYIRVYCS